MIELGVAAATAFSLPRSVGSIFGLIFACPQPIGLEDLVEKLEISRGSASMGLNFLLKMGAIKQAEVEGIRRALYEPEMSLRRLLDGLLQATILPHLQSGGEKLENLETLLSEESPADRKILAKRIVTLRAWKRKVEQLAPLAARVLGTRKTR